MHQIDIINLALTRMGQASVTSLTEGSADAANAAGADWTASKPGIVKNNSSSNGPLPQMALGQIPGSRDNGNNPPSTGLLTGLTGANKYTKDSVVFSVVGMASSTTENHIRNMDMAIILEPTVNVRAYRIQQAWPMYIQFYEL